MVGVVFLNALKNIRGNHATAKPNQAAVMPLNRLKCRSDTEKQPNELPLDFIELLLLLLPLLFLHHQFTEKFDCENDCENFDDDFNCLNYINNHCRLFD